MGTPGKYISTLERELIKRQESNQGYEYHNGGFRSESSDRSHDLSSTSTFRDNPHIKCNGTINNSLISQSKPSLNQSRRSLCNASKVTYYGKTFGVDKSLASLGLIAILSLLLAILSIQLTFKLSVLQQNFQTMGRNVRNETLFTKYYYGNVLEATIAITTFVMMLDLSSLMVCTLQFFYAAKILKVSQGDERAFKYLKDCSSTRFIGVSCFFVSIPALFIALLLYIMMEFRSMTSIIATGIIVTGIIFIFITLVHNTYHWRKEKNKANNNLPPFLDNHCKNSNCDPTKSELSTLV